MIYSMEFDMNWWIDKLPEFQRNILYDHLSGDSNKVIAERYDITKSFVYSVYTKYETAKESLMKISNAEDSIWQLNLSKRIIMSLNRHGISTISELKSAIEKGEYIRSIGNNTKAYFTIVKELEKVES